MATTCLANGKAKVVAHRGFWATEGSAQNSIRSLVKADSIGCWGSEFDVWMTQDGKLVVNHDDNINGIVIETSTSKEVTAQNWPMASTCLIFLPILMPFVSTLTLRWCAN